MNILNFVLIMSCALVKATVFIKAPCPDVKPVDDFNWTAYKGVWYEVARYPDDWEKQGDCGMMEYDLNSPNTFNLSNVVNQKRVSIMGTVKVDKGVLYHESSNFNNYCWVMSRDRKNSEVTKKAGDFVKSLGVIDTSELAWSHLSDDICLL